MIKYIVFGGVSMTSLFKSRPCVKEKSGVYIFFTIMFAIIGISVVLLPVAVNIMNKFSTTESFADILYCIFRGLFGISVAIGAGIFAVKKDTISFTIPCFIGFITVLFPLYNSVYGFVEALIIAKQLSMQMGYLTFMLDALKYLVYTLLCLFTILYTLGWFKFPSVITLLSFLGTLGTIALSMHSYITYDITAYEVLCVSDGAILSILPLMLLFTTKMVKKDKKSSPYKPRRMR